MIRETPWYESFFGPDYLEVYGYQFTPERAESETGFAVRVLALKPGEQVSTWRSPKRRRDTRA
jgi:hypothetical protein